MVSPEQDAQQELPPEERQKPLVIIVDTQTQRSCRVYTIKQYQGNFRLSKTSFWICSPSSRPDDPYIRL